MSAIIPTPITFIDTGRGYTNSLLSTGGVGVFRWPSDPIGTFSLTLTNVVVGSRIAIRDQAKTTVKYDQIASAGTVEITLPVYSSGAPLNDWLIDIRKGSAAPYYQRYKTLLTATVGASSLYINQLPDQR